LLLDDLGDDLRGDRLDVGSVGQIRIGHDRGRIGVDQDDPVALRLERLAGLRAGIVELAGLADDDRASANDQDRGAVGALRHVLGLFFGFILWIYSWIHLWIYLRHVARWSSRLARGTQKKGALLRVLRPAPRPSGPIPKFASTCGTFGCELRNP